MGLSWERFMNRPNSYKRVANSAYRTVLVCCRLLLSGVALPSNILCSSSRVIRWLLCLSRFQAFQRPDTQ